MLGKLNGESADATARAVDQYPLSGCDVGVLEHRLPRGKAGDRDGAGVGEGNGGGCRNQAVGCGGDVLGRGATAVHAADNPVADGEGVHAAAHLHDGAGEVPAKRVGQIQLEDRAQQPGAQPNL